MNTASVVLVVVLFVLAGLAVWRNVKKGAPCACGCSCKACGGGRGEGCGRDGRGCVSRADRRAGGRVGARA